MKVENDLDMKHISLKPSLVLEVEARKVGIVGYLTPQTRALSTGIGVEFNDEIEAIK